MIAADIMKTPVIKAKEQDSVKVVIQKFLDYGISGLPIVNESNEIISYISDGDIMRYIGKYSDLIFDTFYFVSIVKGDQTEFTSRVKKILDMNVMKIGQKNVNKVAWDESIERIAAILGRKHIKKLPVERNGVLVGIISRGDVIRHSFKSFI